ncbi:MAG: trypsin-like peptidase domain-containing protein, partial [Nitrospirae bacterium]|nr:trypsin-like peptidase domain-containing protein [Nitrospirota bacterium]
QQDQAGQPPVLRLPQARHVHHQHLSQLLQPPATLVTPCTQNADEPDFVILKLDVEDLPPLSLGDSDTLQVGQPIYAVGFPQVGDLAALGSIESALVPSLSDGIISGRRRMAGADTLQVSAPISPGSSGGPIINMGSQVVGVATFALREGQNMNFAVPSAYLKPFLRLPVKPIAEAPWCNAGSAASSQSRAGPTSQATSGPWSICMVVERGKKADMWCYPSQEKCRDAERQTRQDQAWKIAAGCHPARD